MTPFGQGIFSLAVAALPTDHSPVDDEDGPDTEPPYDPNEESYKERYGWRGGRDA